MAARRSRPSSARREGRQNNFSLGQLDQLQRQRAHAAREFVAASMRYASVGETEARTAEAIGLLIDRYPTCPKFASMLVDQLMAGSEDLQAALREELN